MPAGEAAMLQPFDNRRAPIGGFPQPRRCPSVQPFPERKMTSNKVLGLMLTASFFLCAAAHAKDSCRLTLKPETSGFFLNPVLEKVTITKVSPQAPGAACVLMVDDEILQLNDQRVVGQRAKTVMAYWKSLKPGDPRNFKVRRAGVVLAIAVK
jgi:hypothetical protein